MCVCVCVSHHLLPSRQPGPRPWVPPAGMPCSRHPPATPLDGGQLEPPSPCYLPLLHCTPRSQGFLSSIALLVPRVMALPTQVYCLDQPIGSVFSGWRGGWGVAVCSTGGRWVWPSWDLQAGGSHTCLMRPLTARGRAESGNKVGVGGISILGPRPCRRWSWTRWIHPIRTLARRHRHKWKKKKKDLLLHWVE